MLQGETPVGAFALPVAGFLFAKMLRFSNYSKEDILKEVENNGFFPTIACLLTTIAAYIKDVKEDRDKELIAENVKYVRDAIVIVDNAYKLEKRDKRRKFN